MKIRLPLACLVLLALGLRLYGIGWGMPFRLHPDAAKYVQPASRCGAGDFNPRYFENPSGYTYPLWLWLTAVNTVEQARGAIEPLPSVYERYVTEPWRAELWGRWIVALIGAGSVLLMFALARKITSDRGALVAGLVLSVCFLHVRQSRYAVNDVPMLAVFLAATWLTVRLWETGRWRDLAFAALVAGYATGTKYTACVAVPAILPAVLWPRDPGMRSSRSSPCGRLPTAAGVLVLSSGLGFLIACPYALLDASLFLEQLRGLAGGRIHRWEGQGVVPVWILMVQSLLVGVGVGPLVVSLAGLWKERHTSAFPWRTFAPLWAGPLSLLLLVVQPLFFARFALPLVPFLALLTGWAFDRLAMTQRRGYLVWLLVAVVAGESLVRSVRQGWICTQADTRVMAVSLLAERQALAVAADHFALPFRYRDAKNRVWHADMGERLAEIDPEQLASDGIRWLAVSSFAMRAMADSEGVEALLSWQERVAEFYELAVQVSAGESVPYHLEHSHTPFIGLFSTERPGPDILVLRRSLPENADAENTNQPSATPDRPGSAETAPQ